MSPEDRIPTNAGLLTPVEADRLIIRTVNEIARGIEQSRALQQAFLDTERIHDYEYALAFGRLTGPQGDKRYLAEVSTTKFRQDRDIAEVAWRHMERKLRSLQSELDALRTLGANLREAFRTGGER